MRRPTQFAMDLCKKIYRSCIISIGLSISAVGGKWILAYWNETIFFIWNRHIWTNILFFCVQF